MIVYNNSNVNYRVTVHENATDMARDVAKKVVGKLSDMGITAEQEEIDAGSKGVVILWVEDKSGRPITTEGYVHPSDIDLQKGAG
jgi:hypothetical protein